LLVQMLFLGEKNTSSLNETMNQSTSESTQNQSCDGDQYTDTCEENKNSMLVAMFKDAISVRTSSGQAM